ncbi:MAG: DnaJ domain-containing protein [Candidatus Diapherotrites archaeon]|nr:DnaJ domain-containing protein [Candidatus Diapherotrites archaeon]
MEERHSFEKIKWARKALGLQEKASVGLIKEKYRTLAKKWHPDKCRKKPEECKKRMQEINEAFATIAAYCENFEISFEKEAIEKHDAFADYGEWWLKQFGKDPIWGNSNRIKKEAKK